MTCREVYLVDASAYIYRAYHALTPLHNSHGLPTHAVYGFTTILRRILRERQPEYLAVAFDTRGPVFRHRIYPAYKANRPAMPDDLAAQIPYVKRIVQSYNILVLEHADQEADDMIASAVCRLAGGECRVVIVSGDKDLLQLVTGNVSFWDPMSDRTMSPETIRDKYGLTPAQLLDFFALTGDSSDNVPGVPGVGPKTAAKLLREYGSLEKLFASLDAMKASRVRDNLAAHRDEAFLSRDLIRLNTEAEVPGDRERYRLREPDSDALRSLLAELEFYSLLKSDVPPAKVDTQGFSLVQTREQLRELIDSLAGAQQIVIDTETSSLDPLTTDLVGLSICETRDQVWYIPCGHRDEGADLVPDQLTVGEITDALRPLLEKTGLPKIGHNIKFDLAVLALPHNGGINLTPPLYDTMVAAWLIDPGRRSYKLDDLCLEFDVQMTSFAEVVGGDKREDSFTRVELGKARDYCCEDAFGTSLVFEAQRPRLEDMGLWKLFVELECPLIPVLAGMERTGIMVDIRMLAELSDEFGRKLEELEQDIYRLAGMRFNVNSPQQLGEVLFERLNLPRGRKTKTGFSTDVKVLERLGQHHELPRLILNYRNLAKLKSTYVDKLSSMAAKTDGRVHTSFNQCGTATGRLSSSNPNLQNIPVRTEDGQRIRSAFIAAPGHVLLAGDYSQIDLRVLAHYSGDQALLEAFRAGGDIHRQTAADIFFVSPGLITPEMRRVAKTINFGIVYGMSSFGLSSQLNISRREAQVFIDRYFDHYPGIKAFMESIVEKAREDGYVSTLLGRRRVLPDINHPNRTRREFAERTAINTPIQGTAADIIKLAMLRTDRELRERRLGGRLILQVHDELVLEVPEEEREATGELLRAAMEDVVSLDVPLVVNLSANTSLAKI
ncbi:MAG: DNA polymerase I [Desulfobulbaceae bacterium]|jgi:DNA polymerase-1|nr:DNA polymerase I [Desulfobulbaceae bacterium]